MQCCKALIIIRGRLVQLKLGIGKITFFKVGDMYEINLFVDFSYFKVLLLCTQKYKEHQHELVPQLFFIGTRL